MQKLDFGEALEVIRKKDSRYDRDAYHFLRDALDYTIKQRKKAREGGACGHVSGQQLLEGIRLYALKQFGPMVLPVFEYWGVQRCDDFGEMVFNLISVGIFGKTETDTLGDFRGAYTFHDAFVAPFLPEHPVLHPRFRMDSPAQELR